MQVLKAQEGALQQLEEAGLLLQAAERTQQEMSGGLRDLQRGLALEAGTPGGRLSCGSLTSDYAETMCAWHLR